MKKSLVMMVVLVGSLALAGSVFAGGMTKPLRRGGLGLLFYSDLQTGSLQRPGSVQRESQRR